MRLQVVRLGGGCEDWVGCCMVWVRRGLGEAWVGEGVGWVLRGLGAAWFG